MKRRSAALALTLLLVPAALFAQTENDQLRSQIRADLLKDPRSQELSQVELDALVSALAEQAVEDGTAADYLEAQNTFDYSKLFEVPKDTTLKGLLSSPLMIALLFLIVVLLLVIFYIVRRSGPKGSLDPSA